jgi:hypothetical protein
MFLLVIVVVKKFRIQLNMNILSCFRRKKKLASGQYCLLLSSIDFAEVGAKKISSPFLADDLGQLSRVIFISLRPARWQLSS